MALKKNQTAKDVKRVRLTVPVDDHAVIEWLSHQYSPSLSIRMLIRKAVEEGGMRDWFATDEGEVKRAPRRGRPPKEFVPYTEADDAGKEPEAKVEAEEPRAAAHAETHAEPAAAPAAPSGDAAERIRRMQGFLNK